MPKRSSIILALLCVYIFWGGTYLGMRYAIQTIPPFLMASLRFSTAGWILYALLRLKGEPNPSFSEWKNAGFVGILLLVGGNAIVALAEQQVPSSIASLLIALVPLWITVITYIVERKKPNIGSIIGIPMGLIGVAILVWNPGGSTEHATSIVGIISILLASISWSVGSYISRRMKLPKAPLLATAIQMIVGGAALVLVAALHGDFVGFRLAAVSGTSWLAMAYLILCGSLLGYTAYIWLFRNAEPSIASTYAYVNPNVAMLLGGLIAGEHIGNNALVAAVIIITSVAVITVTRDDKRKKEPLR